MNRITDRVNQRHAGQTFPHEGTGINCPWGDRNVDCAPSAEAALSKNSPARCYHRLDEGPRKIHRAQIMGAAHTAKSAPGHHRRRTQVEVMALLHRRGLFHDADCARKTAQSRGTGRLHPAQPVATRLRLEALAGITSKPHYCQSWPYAHGRSWTYRIRPRRATLAASQSGNWVGPASRKGSENE
jgi:hypothetical protein